jgi:hypothetical protein
MHLEAEHDVAAQRHGGVRHEPVAPDLRDEPAQPRSEVDAFRVELNRRPEVAVPLHVLQGFALRVLLHVPDRVADHAGCRAPQGWVPRGLVPDNRRHRRVRQPQRVGIGRRRGPVLGASVGLRRARLLRRLRPVLRGVADNLLRRIAARERDVVLRVRRLLHRLRPAIAIGELRQLRRDLGADFDLRGDEHELRAIAQVLLFLLALRLEPLFLRGVHRLDEGQVRPRHDGNENEQMHHDRQEDDLQLGQGPIQRRYLRAIVLEIEVHQWFTRL